MEKKVYDQVESFLDPIYKDISSNNNEDRPFITLTFAQSLDGKISKTGQQILISGKESMAMTHRLRTLHDGIMVGIGTARIDNPQLNARYISPDTKIIHQPQPIVLDPFLKLSPTCSRLVKNYQNKVGKQVWLVTSSKGCLQNKEKKLELENLGVKILMVETEDDRLPLPQVFQLLKKHGIKSLMIEGGSKIIQSCLLSTLFDQLIITTAPMFIGSDGVPAITTMTDIMKLKNVKYTTLGNDIVMSATK